MQRKAWKQKLECSLIMMSRCPALPVVKWIPLFNDVV